MKARRQRLALKKQLRRALAQQRLLERQVVHLQQMLEVTLQVSRDCSFVQQVVMRLVFSFCSS